MAHFAAGVTVVTTVRDGLAHALTATAFASVSLEPPLVLVCVGKASRFHSAVLGGTGMWAVSLLAADQEALARHFARRGRDLVGQFDGIATTRAAHSGAPVLTGALAWLDCATTAQHDAGDHTIVVGKVLATGDGSSGGFNGQDRPPLTYYRSTYLGLS